MTIEQKQCLLKYLGYYKDDVDGVWGSNSKKATEEFQEDYGLDADGIFGAKTEEMIIKAVSGEATPKNWWDDIKYFTRSEFKCKCGGKYCNGYPTEMKEKVVKIADDVRAHFNAPATVISGLRDKTHNKNEGGVSNSRHMSGKAIDLRVKGVSADSLLAYVKKQPGVRYAYKINSTNVHFDIQ